MGHRGLLRAASVAVLATALGCGSGEERPAADTLAAEEILAPAGEAEESGVEPTGAAPESPPAVSAQAPDAPAEATATPSES